MSLVEVQELVPNCYHQRIIVQFDNQISVAAGSVSTTISTEPSVMTDALDKTGVFWSVWVNEANLK